MVCARFALSVAMALVSPFAVLIVGVAIVLAMTNGEGASPSDQAGLARAGRATVSDDGECAHVTVDVAAADLSTSLLVHGKGGEVLAKLLVYRDGVFTLEAPQSDPVRFLIHRSDTRSVQLAVNNSRANFALHAQAVGSTRVIVTDGSDNPMHGLTVNADGNLRTRDDAPPTSPEDRQLTAAPRRENGWSKSTEVHSVRAAR
jgi:hypothetical protein